MFSAAVKSFWHTMTSNDRHSNYNSPYRTGQHVPLNPESRRMSALASVATASESRADVSSPYSDDSPAGLNHILSPTGHQHPLPSPALSRTASNTVPYSPGARSDSARRQSQTNDGFEMHSPTGEIPMQSFQDGLPPAPPVAHSWHRIDKWADENYPELYDQLCEGCTTNDINELEHMLDCTLPLDVRESLQVHDGQERGGMPTGIIFGSMLLDCEEIVQEWDQWRKVNHEYLLQESSAAAATAAAQPTVPPKTLDGNATNIGSGSVDGSNEASSSKGAPSVTTTGNPMWRQELLSRQDSVPHNSVQKAYAHPAWIPLVRDWGGNNLAIDLAPGPAGQWGQVILFGRDYDVKYVVARSWADLIARVADDLNSGKWYIDEDSNELKLREFKTTRVEPGYFDILRWRTDQKFGRRPKRRSVVPGAAAASPTGSGANSPYAGPTDPQMEPRGRPLQRLSVASPLGSPNRPGYGKSSPLARVTEEASLPELDLAAANGKAPEKLVEVETPRVSGEGVASKGTSTPPSSKTPANTTPESKSKTVAATEKISAAAADETMKTIEI